jgi:hypothetical protein
VLRLFTIILTEALLTSGLKAKVLTVNSMTCSLPGTKQSRLNECAPLDYEKQDEHLCLKAFQRVRTLPVLSKVVRSTPDKYMLKRRQFFPGKIFPCPRLDTICYIYAQK